MAAEQSQRPLAVAGMSVLGAMCYGGRCIEAAGEALTSFAAGLKPAITLGNRQAAGICHPAGRG